MRIIMQFKMGSEELPANMAELSNMTYTMADDHHGDMEKYFVETEKHFNKEITKFLDHVRLWWKEHAPDKQTKKGE